MNTEHKFHGYSITSRANSLTTMACGNTAVQLHIGKLPRRKGICLYLAETNKFVAQITPLAYFKTENAAKECQRVLDWMILREEPKP